MDLLSTFSFSVPTRIEFGVGTADMIAGEIDTLGLSRILIMTDPGVQAAGVGQSIVSQAQTAANSVELFANIEPNPRDFTVLRAAELGRGMDAQLLIAIGGGSVIDAAKAVGILLTSGGIPQDYEGRGKVQRPITPLIAVPTTAGTGSEATFSSVITDAHHRRKFSINSTLATASVAVLDPQLTVTLPPDITASTGMDALTHAIEGLSATCSNPISEVAALAAVRLITANLKAAVSDGSDMAARSGMLLGSLLAGIAFANADVGAVHCMAEALGGLYDTPHGIANSIFLPAVMRFNTQAVPDKFALAAAAMGIQTQGLTDVQAAQLAVDFVKGLAVDVGIPQLSELGLCDIDLDELSTVAANNGSVPSNPRRIGKQEFHDLFQAALDT